MRQDDRSVIHRALTDYWQIIAAALMAAVVAGSAQSSLASQERRITSLEGDMTPVKEHIAGIEATQVAQRDLLRHIDHRLDVLTEGK